MSNVCCVTLTIGLSNDEVIGLMRSMKSVRENRPGTQVVCSITGFGSDPRDLWAIPEVRAFCRRLVTLGFPSYLEAYTALSPESRGTPIELALGAAEVWLIGEGRFRSPMPVERELIDEIRESIGRANAAADALLGPLGDHQVG